MAWLPDGKKIDDMFIRFDRMYKRDRRTHTETPRDDMGCACIASRGKTEEQRTIIQQYGNWYTGR